jgi:hypothetical protein
VRCNDVSVTSDGSPDSRFRRALATGNRTLVLAAAAELPRLSLADALAVCLVLCGDRDRYSRAAVRWHGRLCTEARRLSAVEAQLALSCLQALPTPAGRAAARTLAELCRSHGLSESATILERWTSSV